MYKLFLVNFDKSQEFIEVLHIHQLFNELTCPLAVKASDDYVPSAQDDLHDVDFWTLTSSADLVSQWARRSESVVDFLRQQETRGGAQALDPWSVEGPPCSRATSHPARTNITCIFTLTR